MTDEPNCPITFDFAFEVVEDVGDMRKMILDEVLRFRSLVRNPQGQQPQAPGIAQQQAQPAQGQVQQGQVPIPEQRNPGQWRQEEAHPQEMTQAAHGSQGEMDLNQVLQNGLDAMHQ